MIGSDVEKAVELLKSGEIIGLPTETVYGLAGSAFNEQAILKIFKVKNRPFFDPLIVHLANIDQIESVVGDFPMKARKLANAFMPGPFTLLLKKKQTISDLVTAGSGLVAVRIPQHPMTLKVLAKLDFPLAAPSANPFGYISPTTAEHVAEQLGDKIPYILDGGPTKVGIESTIVGFEADRVIVYRNGGTTNEAIESVLGMSLGKKTKREEAMTPGSSKSHYAPRTPFWLGSIEELYEKTIDQKIGVLVFRKRKVLPESIPQLV